jgi:DNA-binding XRE family transcriptional regulator
MSRISPSLALRRQQVAEIVTLLREHVEQDTIAQKFGISKKTVNRIKMGETWSSISGIPRKKPTLKPAVPLPEPSIPAENERVLFLQEATKESTEYMAQAPKEFKEFVDWLIGVKNAYGFSFSRPICWGWYDWHDGVHAVATDMEIAWESQELVDYAQKAVSYNCPYSPVFSNEARELPTFSLEYLMNRPIGKPLTFVSDTGSMTSYTTSTGKLVVLRKKYVIIAQNNKLEIREAVGHTDFVYFTKNKNRSTSETATAVIAAVVTISPTQAQVETKAAPKRETHRKIIRSA